MTRPTPQDVAAFTGATVNDGWTAKAGATLQIVEQMVRAYTRSNGFDATTSDPNDALAAVIVSSTARLMSNPSGAIQETAGPYSITHGQFAGWTLPELAILHSYRKRAT